MMKFFIIIFLALTSLVAFDYDKLINTKAFSIPVLNQIAQIDSELQNENNKEVQTQLVMQQQVLIEDFLANLVAGKYDTKLLQTKQELEMWQSQVQDIGSHNTNAGYDRSKFLDQLSINLNYDSAKLSYSFALFLTTLKKNIDSLEHRSNFARIFAEFKLQGLVQNQGLYEMVHKDILENGVNKTPAMLEYLISYNNFQSKERVFNAIYVHLEKYVGNLTMSDQAVSLLKVGPLIHWVNSRYGKDDISKQLKQEIGLNIGELAAIVAVLIGFILGYFLLFNVVKRVLVYFVCHEHIIKDAAQCGGTLSSFIDATFKKPTTLFLIVLFFNFVQHILYVSSLSNTTSNDNVDFTFISFVYAGIMVWTLFRLVDNIVVYYSGNILQKYPTMRRELITFFLIFVKVSILLIALVVILKMMNYSITGLMASLGIGGLAIALAAKEALTNMFGSIQLILDNTFSQGDWIVTDKYQGTVIEIGLRSTKIRTFANAYVSAPNAYLAQTEIKNWNRRVLGRRIKMIIGTSYTVRLSVVKQAVDEIRQMLIDHPDIADDSTQYVFTAEQQKHMVSRDDAYGVKRTLLVFIDDFGESTVNILVYCFSKSTDWATWLGVKEDVMMKIEAIFYKYGMPFAYPSRSLYVEKLPHDLDQDPSAASLQQPLPSPTPPAS